MIAAVRPVMQPNNVVAFGLSWSQQYAVRHKKTNEKTLPNETSVGNGNSDQSLIVHGYCCVYTCLTWRLLRCPKSQMSSTRLTIDSQNEGANTSLLNKAVFLDRDGILNHAIVRNGRPYAPTRLSEFKLIEGVSDCLIRLKSARFLTVVVTNQPDVSRGQITRKELAAMHEKLSRELALDDIFVCECTNECPCYKPQPGMLVEAAEKWSIDLSNSYIIGDRWRDVGAGFHAGCKTIFVDYGYNETTPFVPTKTVCSTKAAVDWLLADAAL